MLEEEEPYPKPVEVRMLYDANPLCDTRQGPEPKKSNAISFYIADFLIHILHHPIDTPLHIHAIELLITLVTHSHSPNADRKIRTHHNP